MDSQRKMFPPPLTFTLEQSWNWSDFKVVASVPRLKSKSTFVQGYEPGGALLKRVSIARVPREWICLCGVLYLECDNKKEGFFVLWGFESKPSISMSGSWWENAAPFVLLSKSLDNLWSSSFPNPPAWGSFTTSQNTDSQEMIEKIIMNLDDFPKPENRITNYPTGKAGLVVEDVGDSSKLIIGPVAKDGSALSALASIEQVTFLGRKGYHLILKLI